MAADQVMDQRLAEQFRQMRQAAGELLAAPPAHMLSREVAAARRVREVADNYVRTMLAKAHAKVIRG